ncbi:MAG: DUF5343 domain-containing protein [Dehalococcoidia bacterium]|nr:DUF5343 domain-containing protein [Dehalococcoidia bacterium]
MELGTQSDIKRRVPPYGPVKGMVEGLQLLQRLSPSLVDEALLRANKVAPNNEYKVVGALRFLDLIDDEGKPTEKSRLLKTRGATYMLNLQELVRQAYSDLFKQIALRQATRDQIYNYFVTEARMGGEMAVKAMRFFIELCRLSGFETSAELQGGRAPKSASPRTAQPRAKKAPSYPAVSTRDEMPTVVSSTTSLPFTLAVTAELVSMNEDDLEQVFGRILRAWRRAIE